jgi:choline dehydrogenase-like flavoprotein
MADRAEGAPLEVDLCIAGAGAAGITLARNLASSSRRILLLESGDLQPDAETQALYAGPVSGPMDYPLAGTRLRFFGGSTNCWSGFCMPLDETDFLSRPWVPHSGWPFGLEKLWAYYEKAQSILDLGTMLYQRDPRLNAREPWLELKPEKLVYRYWQNNGPKRFNLAYADEISSDPRIQLLLGANVTEVQLDREGRRVEQLQVADLHGRTLMVKARKFVLALGGIENARILLASRGSSPSGVGNDRDQVGRYFMEHPLVPSARFFPTRYTGWLHANTNIQFPGSGVGIAGYGVSPEARRSKEILDVVMTISEGRADWDAGYMTLARLRRAWSEGQEIDDLSGDIWKIVTDLDDVWDGISANITGEHYNPVLSEDGALTINTHLEQAPHLDSRVRLGEEVDALGIPRASLEWRLGELEIRTIAEGNRLLGEELARLQLGRVQIDPWLLGEAEPWPGLRFKCHHIGTTRMSESTGEGVVNSDCRVHGIENLWIAGSSVFPTGGVANPTLTIVALSLRLADHLDQLG